MGLKGFAAALGITAKVFSSIVGGSPDAPKQYTDHSRTQQTQRAAQNKQNAKAGASRRGQPGQHPPKKR